MTIRPLASVLAFVAISGGALLAQRGSDAAASSSLHLKGFGGVMDSKTGFHATTPVEVVITRFSTDAERDRLATAGIPGLRELPVVGQVTMSGAPLYDVHYAERRSFGGGREEVGLVMNRVVDVVRRRVSDAYPITFVTIHLESTGPGFGFLFGTQHLTYAKSKNLFTATDDDPNQITLQSLRVVAEPPGPANH